MKKMVTIKQLAEMWDGAISEGAIRKWQKQGRFPYYKVSGKKILIDPEEFQKYIESYRVEAVDVNLKNRSLGYIDDFEQGRIR